MALIPRTTYSGQVSTSDPNYPLGKAQDEAVSGDGTGTPLEAAWINDIWGFLQAILNAGGVTTPSGNPDAVGASEYLNALNARSPTWSGTHTFDLSPQAAGTAEYQYAAGGRVRSFLVPIELGVPSSTSTATYTDANGWAFQDPADTVILPLDLPSGSVIQGIQAGVDNQTYANTVTIRIQRVTPNLSGGSSTVGSAVNISSSGTSVGVAGNNALSIPVDNSASRLRLTILAGTGDGAVSRGKCFWVKLTVLDPGPRNL